MREPLKDKERLEHILSVIDTILQRTEGMTLESVHKSLIQTALRMKARNYDFDEICKITGLSREEIEKL